MARWRGCSKRGGEGAFVARLCDRGQLGRREHMTRVGHAVLDRDAIGRGRRVHLAEPCAAEGGALRERREVVEFIVEPVLLVHGEAWWLKAENLQPWGGLRRAPEATVSLRDAQAALWGA